jgi:hypothetical protein
VREVPGQFSGSQFILRLPGDTDGQGGPVPAAAAAAWAPALPCTWHFPVTVYKVRSQTLSRRLLNAP